jgi:glycyl-tRNA synthetase (class II)
MPHSPSIIPENSHPDIYLVLDDFGSLGRVWRETDEMGTNRATLVRNMLEDQYENPVRIVAFNTAEGWSRDVTIDIADELRRRYVEFDEVPASVLKFLETTIRH